MQCMDISYHSYLCNCNHLSFHVIPFARCTFANFCYWPGVYLWIYDLGSGYFEHESQRRNAEKTNPFSLGNHTPRSLARAQEHKAANQLFFWYTKLGLEKWFQTVALGSQTRFRVWNHCIYSSFQVWICNRIEAVRLTNGKPFSLLGLKLMSLHFRKVAKSTRRQIVTWWRRQRDELAQLLKELSQVRGECVRISVLHAYDAWKRL